MKYLFWNTNNNKDINGTICELVVEHEISFVVLAEYSAEVKELIELLACHNVSMSEYPNCSERITILGQVQSIEPRTDTDHAIIRIINQKDILCCVHLNSKIFSGHEDHREIIIEQIIKDIRDIEQELETENTIVVGDFNLNPYDASFINARYFHGLPVYADARRRSRIVADKECYMFYNPMWNFLGDFKQPYGTYYHGGSEALNAFWNIYDQVIIRPALRDRFVSKSLKIITETKTMFLLNNKGHPNKKISDHLPIVFEIKED